MAVVTKNIWATIKELLLEQYRANLRPQIEAEGCTLPTGADNRLQGLLKVVIDELIQPMDDAAVAMQNILDIDSASGQWLDVIGKIAGVQREYGESDSSFRNRIKNEVVVNKGTPDAVEYSCALLSGDPQPQYMDEAPATFFVYDGPCYRWVDGAWTWTEGGAQLTRAQVKNLAPAGVLGLPGAAIDTGDGILLGTYAENEEDRKILLVVANDDNVEREVLLADNLGNIVVTPQSVPVRVRLVGSEVPNIPTIETEWQGVPVDAVRIKDLPDAQYDNAYMVRDSDAGGTTRINESEVGIQMKPSGTNTLKFYRRNPNESDTEG